MEIFKKINSLLSALERWLVIIAAICLLLIMFIVVMDVLMRYVFNSPFIWSYELISMYLMVTVFFFSLSNTLDEDGHISVDILHMKISKRKRHAFLSFGYWLSLIVFSIIFYTSLGESWMSYINKDVTDGLIEWPIWISWSIVPVGVFFLIIRVFLLAVGNTVSFFSNESFISLPLISGHEKE